LHYSQPTGLVKCGPRTTSRTSATVKAKRVEAIGSAVITPSGSSGENHVSTPVPVDSAT
jgi:hypothetical protein